MRAVRDFLNEVRSGGQSALELHSYRGLSAGQIQALAAQDYLTYTGKVRDVVTTHQDLLLVHSDRLTAFDRLIGWVPYKGTILTSIANFWLEDAKKVVPTHLLGKPQERVLRCQRATPFKVEVVVRGYLAGSMLRAYEKGEREYCGQDLPDGLRAYGPLPKPLITPTTKAAAFDHDENTSSVELVARGVCTDSEWREISDMTLALFHHGQKVFRRFGWLLVDTKYEFGRTQDGRIIVIDEVHTPDSSRLWQENTYAARLSGGEAPEMLDKENVRRYLLKQGFSGDGPVPTVPVQTLVDLAETYLHVAETLIGAPLMSAGPSPMLEVSRLASPK